MPCHIQRAPGEISWEEPAQASPCGSEGGTARLASGKLLATIRYQRPLLPDDPPDLIEKTGQWRKEAYGTLPTFPYKHIFLADSKDEGETWNDEGYYVYYGLGTSGYNQSLVLEDDVILTVAGTSDNLEAKSWQNWVGTCDTWAIRWKLS